MIRRRVVVSGEVQGVFFRDSCRRTAAGHRVSGWVRNLAGGDVEAAFEGEPEGVDRMVAWVYQGPPAARVEKVVVTVEEPEGLIGFAVLPDA